MNYLENALEIIKKINKNGYDAYIVGGAVRDYLLNTPLNDIDLTTNMPLDIIKKLFSTEDTGINYLGITIIINNYSYEITNFRRDILYSDNRHPIVELVNTFKEDSIRRDFTINAMAMDKDKNIIDYHNGKLDISNKIIRAIGNPDTRFKEDSLRILRALHYASKLNFTIEDNTLNAIVLNKSLLKKLSNERLYSYILKLKNAKYEKGIEYINEYDLFSEVIEYKKWVLIINKEVSDDDMPIYYYIKYNELPSIAKANDKRRCKILKEILDNIDEIYTLFKYYNEIIEFYPILKILGCDIISLDEKLRGLKIKSNKDLMCSVDKITEGFSGNLKGKALKQVIEGILLGEINNDEDSIMEYVRSL